MFKSTIEVCGRSVPDYLLSSGFSVIRFVRKLSGMGGAVHEVDGSIIPAIVLILRFILLRFINLLFTNYFILSIKHVALVFLLFVQRSYVLSNWLFLYFRFFMCTCRDIDFFCSYFLPPPSQFSMLPAVLSNSRPLYHVLCNARTELLFCYFIIQDEAK